MYDRRGDGFGCAANQRQKSLNSKNKQAAIQSSTWGWIQQATMYS
jgi:hypothetical protein